MEAGILLAEHYVSEALRLQGTALVDMKLMDAALLLEWLQNHWHESLISAVECYQTGPRRLRSKKQVEKLLAILEDHGWIARLDSSAPVNGKKRREVWRIFGKEAT